MKNFSIKKRASIFLLLVGVAYVAGCGVLRNSAEFYRLHPWSEVYGDERSDD
jgi:hypothetical protein